jgi:hypothetical protein
MGTGFGEAVEGWVQLGEWWLDSWSKHLGKIATKVDSGTYTGSDATTDLVECASLAGETVLLLGNQLVEAATVLSGKQDQPVILDTPTPGFATTLKLGASRTLALDGPLTNPLVNDQILAAAVTFIPNVLSANERHFRLHVVATGLAGVGYIGTVAVCDTATMARIETVTVVVQVP